MHRVAVCGRVLGLSVGVSDLATGAQRRWTGESGREVEWTRVSGSPRLKDAETLQGLVDPRPAAYAAVLIHSPKASNNRQAGPFVVVSVDLRAARGFLDRGFHSVRASHETRNVSCALS